MTTIPVKFKAKATGAMVPAHNVEFDIAIPDGLFAPADHTHPEPSQPEAVTAESLSQPGAFADYVESEIKAGRNAVLPSGRIYTNRTVKSNRWHAPTIRGQGMPQHPTHSGGWSTHPDAAQGCTTIIATDPTQPVFDLSFATSATIEDLGIETTGVAIDYYERHKNWGPSHLHCDRVHFRDCSIGIRAGDSPTNNMASDASFDGCVWNRCGVGLEVAHNQGVCWTFEGLCYFFLCDQCVTLNGGGTARLYGVSTYACGTILTQRKGGQNLGLSVIRDLKCDRNSPWKNSAGEVIGDPFPVIVDGPASKDTAVLVDGCNVTVNSEAIPEDWRPFTGSGVQVRLAQKLVMDQHQKQLTQE